MHATVTVSFVLIRPLLFYIFLVVSLYVITCSNINTSYILFDQQQRINKYLVLFFCVYSKTKSKKKQQSMNINVYNGENYSM